MVCSFSLNSSCNSSMVGRGDVDLEMGVNVVGVTRRGSVTDRRRLFIFSRLYMVTIIFCGGSTNSSEYRVSE